MSTIEEAIFTRCTTHAGLAALIETRCYPDRLPGSDEETDPDLSDPAYPAIRYQRISDPDLFSSHDNTGPAEMGRPRFQFDVFAESVTEAKVVADEVERCWSNFRGVVGDVSIYRAIKADRRSGEAEDLNVFNEIIDFFIWFKTPEE